VELFNIYMGFFQFFHNASAVRSKFDNLMIIFICFGSGDCLEMFVFPHKISMLTYGLQLKTSVKDVICMQLASSLKDCPVYI